MKRFLSLLAIGATIAGCYENPRNGVKGDVIILERSTTDALVADGDDVVEFVVHIDPAIPNTSVVTIQTSDGVLAPDTNPSAEVAKKIERKNPGNGLVPFTLRLGNTPGETILSANVGEFADFLTLVKARAPDDPIGQAGGEEAPTLGPMDALAEMGPGDTSGSETFARYLYQCKVAVQRWLKTLELDDDSFVLCEFVDDITGGSIPKEFIAACDKGFRSMLTKGMVIGAPVTSVSVTIDDGASHAVDSSDIAFQEAARGAWREAYPKASPQILEPVMKVAVEGPTEYQGGIVGVLMQRRGIIAGTTEAEGFSRVEAEVPLAEMFGFSTVLRSATQGKAEFTMEFSKYAAVPSGIGEELIKKFREEQAKIKALGAKGGRLTLESLQAQLAEGGMKELPVIIKADVQGSAEVLANSLDKLSTDKVKVKIIHSGVGAINESDVLLATAGGAIIIGFNVRPDRNAADIAEREKVDIRHHTVIYNVTEEIEKAMAGLLDPTFKEVRIGAAQVRDTFKVPKAGVIAGCMVSEGVITRKGDVQVRLIRGGQMVWEGKMASLRRFKDDVGEVKAGFECGIGLAGYNDIQVGDVIEVFQMERVASTA